MGTYTTNYNLFMPSIGEQGWGDLVNGNFTTIDTTMAELNTRLTSVENEVNGNLSCTSITTSGTITANGGIGTEALTTTSISNSGNMTNTGTLTSTGKIYANGGIEGDFAATSLNRVVTVTASTTKYHGTANGERILSFTLCPYVPGVLYTGYCIGKSTSNYKGGVWILSSSNVWNVTGFGGSETTINFTEAKCVVGWVQSGSHYDYIYLPLYDA